MFFWCSFTGHWGVNERKLYRNRVHTKLFYIELKYKQTDIIGEFLVKSEDEITAIKDVMQNIKEINPQS